MKWMITTVLRVLLSISLQCLHIVELEKKYFELTLNLLLCIITLLWKEAYARLMIHS